MPLALPGLRPSPAATLGVLVMLSLLGACNRQTIDSPVPSQAHGPSASQAPHTHRAGPASPTAKTSKPISAVERQKIEALLGPQELKGPPLPSSSHLKSATIESPKREAALRVTGIARNAKLGAVVVTSSGAPWFIDGLQSWPRELLGAQVEVRGVAMRAKLAPDPKTNIKGEHSAGQLGSSQLIRNARWRRVQSTR